MTVLQTVVPEGTWTMRMTKEQMEYVMMLDGVMPEKDVLVSLKDNDDELKWVRGRIISSVTAVPDTTPSSQQT